jgi:multicomponent Na+:H+ antiporter subunit G
MTVAVGCLLAVGVFAAWLGVIAFIRMPTPFQRLHAVSFVNVVAAAPIVTAALLSDGVSSRALKCLFMLFFVVLIGALLTHATGRALHFRGGERR